MIIFTIYMLGPKKDEYGKKGHRTPVRLQVGIEAGIQDCDRVIKYTKTS